MIEVLSLGVALVSALLAYFALPEDTRRRLTQRLRGKLVAPSTIAGVLAEEFETAGHGVGPISDTYELEMLWQIDRDSYQDFSIDLETFGNWWRAFPSGLVAARDEQGEVIGGIGTWPVSRRWARSLTANCNPEELIDEHSIRACLAGNSKPDWYISGIVVRDHQSNFQGKRLLPLMLQRAVMQISMHPRFQINSTLFAMPITEEGARLLRRFNFTEFPGLECEPRLYSRQCSPEFLQMMSTLQPRQT